MRVSRERVAEIGRTSYTRAATTGRSFRVQPRRQGQVRDPTAWLVVPVEVGTGAAYRIDDCLLVVQEGGVGGGHQPAPAAAEHAEGIEVHDLRQLQRLFRQFLLHGLEVPGAERGQGEVRDVPAVGVREKRRDPGLLEPLPESTYGSLGCGVQGQADRKRHG